MKRTERELLFSSFVYNRAVCSPAAMLSIYGPKDAEEFETRYREMFGAPIYPIDTESETFAIPHYLRKGAREVPGNMFWPTPEDRARREMSQRISDALDRVERHPDFKVGVAVMDGIGAIIAPSYRPRVERVCPACGVKHGGPFQYCDGCKTGIDSGR